MSPKYRRRPGIQVRPPRQPSQHHPPRHGGDGRRHAELPGELQLAAIDRGQAGPRQHRLGRSHARGVAHGGADRVRERGRAEQAVRGAQRGSGGGARHRGRAEPERQGVLHGVVTGLPDGGAVHGTIRL